MSRHSRSIKFQSIEEFAATAHVVFYACILFILMMFVRSMFFWTSGNSEMISINSLFQASTNCSEFNDNYQGCVDAENSGKGCSWYSNCQLCTKKAQITAETYEKMCIEKYDANKD